MTNKQLVGTGLFVTNTDISLKIPVQQSFLPVQKIKGPAHDLPKEMVYSNDARNLHFQVNTQCSDGKNESSRKIQFNKQGMFNFFQKIEKIQDQINSYL